MTNENLTPIAAELVALRAQIDDLRKQEKALAAQLKAAGPLTIDLLKHRVTVTAESAKTVETVDWQAIAERLNPSRQLVTAHTSHTIKAIAPSVRVYGRKAA